MIFDSIKNSALYEKISPNLKLALDYMQENDLNQMEPGRYPVADGKVLVIIGSKRTGSAFFIAFLNAIEPAILNAISEESTSWYEPSNRVTFTSTTL